MNCFKQSEIMGLEKPDLMFVKLLLPSDGFQTGGMEGVFKPLPVNILMAVEIFDDNLDQLLDAVQNGTELPNNFPIPDLWHISKGRAKFLPIDDGDTLWNACVMGLMLGNTFYAVKEVCVFGYECEVLLCNHPGSVYKEPLANPNYAEECYYG